MAARCSGVCLAREEQLTAAATAMARSGWSCFALGPASPRSQARSRRFTSARQSRLQKSHMRKPDRSCTMRVSMSELGAFPSNAPAWPASNWPESGSWLIASDLCKLRQGHGISLSRMQKLALDERRLPSQKLRITHSQNHTVAGASFWDATSHYKNINICSVAARE